ncbi:2-methylisoborneol synthase [Catenulispora sp. EB89]|uniref:family 2 encapsulin nanocompartment cargo protein terpene cyclase n=1 Tax=Catenulispora sp. EB89 TaxID=3156257 RepID=UPI003517CAD4
MTLIADTGLVSGGVLPGLAALAGPPPARPPWEAGLPGAGGVPGAEGVSEHWHRDDVDPGPESLLRPPQHPERLAPAPIPLRPWGDGSHSPLYCPATARIDEALATDVNNRLVAWAERIGLHAGHLEEFAKTGFGRLITLAHPECDDPDLLLVSAQMNAAWWASDDYYADETDLGAVAEALPGRLALVSSALDPPPPAGEFSAPLREAVVSDPVLVSLRSALAHVTRHASAAQVMRVRHTTHQMYVSWNAYNAWRHAGLTPEAWRYLAARQHDSFYTSMILIDVVGGYELPAELFANPLFHRALTQAGTAAVLVNDLASAEREAGEDPDCNLVLLLAAERDISIAEATEEVVALHNDIVRGFEASRAALAALPSPELQRFVLGARAWLGGCLEWHDSSSRYK